METEVKITAGIVLFNPDIGRLEENINAIAQQVKAIVLIDNHSKNLFEIKKLISSYQNVHLIENTKNEGIAYALNQILKYSESLFANWVLTLDQDSVVPENLISEYCRFLNLQHIGLLTCIVEDRNVGTLGNVNDNQKEYTELDHCITSASLINISVANEIGGFDNQLFIDSVDHDFCIRVKLAGYSIIRVNSVHLLHEVGHSKIVKFLGKENIIFNHSPFRHYFIIRNKIIIGRKYQRKVFYTRKAIKHFLLVVIFESSKVRKFVSMLKGFYDGMSMKLR